MLRQTCSNFVADAFAEYGSKSLCSKIEDAIKENHTNEKVARWKTFLWRGMPEARQNKLRQSSSQLLSLLVTRPRHPEKCSNMKIL